MTEVSELERLTGLRDSLEFRAFMHRRRAHRAAAGAEWVQEQIDALEEPSCPA